MACICFFQVMSQKWSTTPDKDHHHSYVFLGIHHCFNPSLLLSLVDHTEQRMTHSGRGYLQLELISGTDSAAPWNPFLVCVPRNSHYYYVSYSSHFILFPYPGCHSSSPRFGVTNIRDKKEACDLIWE